MRKCTSRVYDENLGQNVHSFVVEKLPAAVNTRREPYPRPAEMAVAEKPETT